MSNKIIGKVKWYNEDKRFGFIESVDNKDAFVQSSAIITEGYQRLIEGQTVQFEIIMGAKGEQAINVRVVDMSNESIDRVIIEYAKKILALQTSIKELEDLKKG